ncbi:hypothetical protein [Pseudophaeobacter sp.]|uniref:hypothetical protein n=1 Tax=Pseudophaeobacter sp. TaxID=1971739 RepID=UPI0032D8DEEF
MVLFVDPLHIGQIRQEPETLESLRQALKARHAKRKIFLSQGAAKPQTSLPNANCIANCPSSITRLIGLIFCPLLLALDPAALLLSGIQLNRALPLQDLNCFHETATKDQLNQLDMIPTTTTAAIVNASFQIDRKPIIAATARARPNALTLAKLHPLKRGELFKHLTHSAQASISNAGIIMHP